MIMKKHTSTLAVCSIVNPNRRQGTAFALEMKALYSYNQSKDGKKGPLQSVNYLSSVQVHLQILRSLRPP